MTKLGRHAQSGIPAVPWSDCSGKSAEDGSPGLTVSEHCRDVGEVARALIKVLPAHVIGLLGGNPAGAAACHDVGKVSPGYQLKYFREQVRQILPELASHAQENYETKHALISEAALKASFGGGVTAAGIAVGAHHGVRDDPRYPHDAGVFGGPAWAGQRLELIERLAAEFGPVTDSSEADASVLAGLVCVADWIGSDERFFPFSGSPRVENLAAKARQAVTECGWQAPQLKPGLSFAEVFGFTPHLMQLDFIDSVQGPGLYVLEAPMGTGKTEAALYAAYRLITSGVNSGLYFGLPTRLTSDKIHERVRSFLEKVAGGNAAVRLAHGNAWLKEFEKGGGALAPGKEWFSPSKRALLMPFGVGTIDQALMAVIKVRHFFVRCFGLAGKVVVLDEVHSYDVYTGTLLDVLVRRLLAMKCTVIVLSATLTGARRSALLAEPQKLRTADDYPLITAETQAGAWARPSDAPRSMEVDIALRDFEDSKVAEEAVAAATAGQCVLCIANTVAKAQSWYNNVKAAMPEGAFPVGLLHSKFPGWRRDELEDSWTKALGKEGPRPGGCVHVATQVVEQSVDLDADFMISELAPTDMLLQRLGRLWRHPRPKRPCTHASLIVVTRDLDAVESLDDLVARLGKPNTHVYATYVLWQTFQVWKGVRTLRLPGDIRALLEQTYAEPSEALPAFAQEARHALARRAARLRDLATAARADVLGFPTMADREGAATRYSDFPMVDAVIARSVKSTGVVASIVLSNGKKVEVDVNRWVPPFAVELHRNLVPVPCYRLPGAKTPAYLSKYFHDRTPVLIQEADGELSLDGQQTGLRYDGERGLQVMASPRSRGFDREETADIDYDEEGGLDESDW